MNTAAIPDDQAHIGRSSAALSRALRKDIAEGRLAPGAFMPGERELSLKHSVARMTARRALKTLESQGLLRAEPGKGYRVLSLGNDPTKGCPIAFAPYNEESTAGWLELNRLLLSSLQVAARRRGWSVLGVGGAGQEATAIMEQCAAGRAWGLIADTYDPELVRLAARGGLPLVAVDSWEPGLNVDAIFQNGFQGGGQAIDYLVGRGHRRIAWYGQVTKGPHAAARLGGAYTALLRHGLDLPAELRVETGSPDAPAGLRRLLARPDRPTGVAALWQPDAREAHEAIRELGLVGKVELVAWAMAEGYEQSMPAMFPGGPVPAVVTWSLAEMVEMAIERLVSRRENPRLPPVTINIATRLRLPDGTMKSGS